MNSSMHELSVPVSVYLILLIVLSPTASGRNVHLQSDIHKSSLPNLNKGLKSSAIVDKDTISKEFISANQDATTQTREKHANKDRMVEQTMEIAGSSLPDCSHACGSCKPCRRVTVSLMCSVSTEESESCPMAYRCMCKGKSFPIP
ncbi:uncharacterized protein LOC131067280 [Cryptomeria japonica]|uniref:uncharacterized protein LOC131067280 n=1 Tax=Cryptomeria japonica TaxID=3369 RepID=UPI0027DA376A|nr:uncharacterized protein LOC131067280 [Cryptomeria japonica]